MAEPKKYVSPFFAIGIAFLVVGIGAMSAGDSPGPGTFVVLGFIFAILGYIQRGR